MPIYSSVRLQLCLKCLWLTYSEMLKPLSCKPLLHQPIEETSSTKTPVILQGYLYRNYHLKLQNTIICSKISSPSYSYNSYKIIRMIWFKTRQNLFGAIRIEINCSYKKSGFLKNSKTFLSANDMLSGETSVKSSKNRNTPVFVRLKKLIERILVFLITSLISFSEITKLFNKIIHQIFCNRILIS